jgi:hypothetical protein
VELQLLGTKMGNRPTNIEKIKAVRNIYPQYLTLTTMNKTILKELSIPQSVKKFRAFCMISRLVITLTVSRLSLNIPSSFFLSDLHAFLVSPNTDTRLA